MQWFERKNIMLYSNTLYLLYTYILVSMNTVFINIIWWIEIRYGLVAFCLLQDAKENSLEWSRIVATTAVQIVI